MNEANADQLLIDRSLHGENAAFNDLLVKYQSKLSSIVYQYIDNPDHIPDVVQEILLKIFCNLPQYRGESSFYTWIYRIAVNTSMNYIKKNHHLSCFSSNHLAWNDIEDMALIEQNSPELKVFHAEIYIHFCQQFKRLSSELQMSLLLREFEDLPYADIAVAMQCPIGTVRSRIHRAKALLMHKMKPEVRAPD